MARDDLGMLFLNPDMPKEWYGSEFHGVIETHLAALRTNGSTIHTVSDSEGYHYRGDMYSLLTSRNILSKYHWIVLRVNKLYSPVDYDGKGFDLIVPNEESINMIWDLYRTSASVD